MATKWGVLSAGKIAHDFVSSVNLMPKTEHQFVAVAEWQLEQAQKFATLHNIPKAYGSFHELATDPDIEVVYIAIVNNYHYSMAKLMLENGKHVLIEKPMTLNMKKTEELTAFAKSKNLFLMEGIWSRFLPSYQFMRQQIQSGVIGDVYHINANIGTKMDNYPRMVEKKLGGGVIVDMTVYCLDIIAQVWGNVEPEQIKAVGHLNGVGVDVECSAVLLFKGNRTATLTAHSLLELPREAHICGTKGVIRVCSVAASANGIFKVYVNNELHEFKLNDTKLDLFYSGSYGLAYEANEVRQCLKEGRLESNLVTHKDSIYLAKLEEALRKEVGVIYDSDI